MPRNPSSTGIAIGIRVEAELFHWAAVEGEPDAPILIAADEVSAPETYSEAASLSFYRDRTFHIFDQYRVSVVAVRYPEPSAPGPATDSARKRSRIEGVIMEAANSRALSVVTGAFVTSQDAWKPSRRSNTWTGRTFGAWTGVSSHAIERKLFWSQFLRYRAAEYAGCCFNRVRKTPANWLRTRHELRGFYRLRPSAQRRNRRQRDRENQTRKQSSLLFRWRR